MEKYSRRSGDSGVIAYEAGADYIRVKFISGEIYTYSYNKAGRIHVERMKSLAEEGKGLSAYISRYVWDLYD